MKKLIILALPMLFLGAALQGEWQLVTDFEDANEEGNPTVNSKIVGTRIWEVDTEIQGFVGGEADPAPWVGDEGNIALHVDHQQTDVGGMETAYILLPERIENGSVVTLYFRWWMSKNGGHDTGVCMTDWFPEDIQNPNFSFNVGEFAIGDSDDPNLTIKNGYGDHKTWWRLGGEFSIQNFGYSSSNNEANRETPPVVEILGPPDSGKSFVASIPENQQYQPRVWLEMWIVFDTENDIKWEYQVQNDGIQKRNHWAVVDADGNVEQVIDYMFNQEGPTDLDYEGVYMVNWCRPNPINDTQVYMDDVWIDYDGENLTTPPHGKTRTSVEIDTTPRAAGGAGIGSETIRLTIAPPAEAEVGKFVQFVEGMDEDEMPVTMTVGKIASIAGNVLTLEAPLSVAVPANAELVFVDEAPFQTAAGGKLVNISTRGLVGDGDQAMIAGFIVREGNQTVNILVKASELADVGVNPTDILADPVLTLQHGQSVVRVNDNWEDDPEQAQLITDAWGGTSPLAAGSTSSGAVLTLAPGNWTARVNAADGSAFGGLVSLEVYEVDQDL